MDRPSVALGFLVCLAAPLGAQQVRVHTTTTGQFIQLRPLVQDSTGAYAAGAVSHAMPLSEDVELSSWGLGIQGLRAYGLFRFRGALGSELVWPRYDDHFDALAAYLELERTTWRVRLGRQQRASGLGLYAFDGGAVTIRPKPALRFEAYGGRGLARGFNDPINNGAIVGLDPLVPDRGTLLVGVSAWAAPTAGSTIAGVYQREVLNDFSGVVSERVALDAQASVGRRWTFVAQGDYDLAASALGTLRLGVSARLPHAAAASVSLFRYRPTFDLTTIWGAFAPQAHHGASVSVSAPPLGALTLSAGWSVRRYEDITETTPFLVDVGTTSGTWSLGAAWAHDQLSVAGSYRYITGFGGAESGGDIRAAWNRGDRWQLGVSGVAFQNTEYFRVARGTVLGAGADARASVTSRLGVSGRLMQYFHTGNSGMDTPNWSQTRALIQVDWVFGSSADRVGTYR